MAVLAAGLGTRMRSAHPKVLHPLGGRPMLERVLAAVTALAPVETVVVVGYGAEEIRAAIGEGVRYAVQREQLGTGHALAVAVAALSDREGDLLVLYGDMPFLRAETLAALVAHHRRTGAEATLLVTRQGPESRFGRIIRDAEGRFLRIVEYKDATPAERAIAEVNAGVYCFRLGALVANLPRLEPNNAQGEYYLTDLFPFIAAAGRVEAVALGRPEEFYGPNDRAELAAAERKLREEINTRHLLAGVSMPDPAAVYIEEGVIIGRDTVLYPGTVLAGRTEIGEGCSLGPAVEIRDSRLGSGVQVAHSVVIESEIGPHQRVGPFIYLYRGVASGGVVPAITGPWRPTVVPVGEGPGGSD
ncbi:MAG: NTP transferase domain-containing protein [Firmicutes bacterium]|nr:NTP transferase domain-containing protein [Bacillota bacterium]